MATAGGDFASRVPRQSSHNNNYMNHTDHEATFEPYTSDHVMEMGSERAPLSKGATSPTGLPSLETIDRRQLALDNKQSFQRYMKFMYVNSITSVVCMLASLVLLGWNGLYICLAMLICLGSFLFSIYLTQWIFAQDDTNPEMRQMSDAIREGSESYLATQYNAIARFGVAVAILLFGIYLFRDQSTQEISRVTLAILTAVAFVLGSLCSAMAGYMGVWVSVRVNIRVAIAASRLDYSTALLLSFRGGAVSSLLSASLCIVGVTALYLFCYFVFVTVGGVSPEHVPVLLAGYGFGSSFVALFMQLGGGIYTKAADVGADMVGKVEQNIPEDDPRNPAVIADLVGDNVGDCAGSMADVFESIAAEVIGTMILGGTLAHEAKIPIEPFIFFPLVVHAFDLLVSSIGIMLVRVRSAEENPLAAMQRGYNIAMGCALVAFVAATRAMLYTEVAPLAWLYFAGCGFVGIVTSYLLVFSTQYFTDYDYPPVQSIAAASRTGHGTNVIQGMSVGLESTGPPIMIICAALLSSYTLGRFSGLPGAAAGVFGTAVATMGMLCTAVFILSMNNFGPIADNAGGIVELSKQSEEVRNITDRLDAVGNVTKAASKGYAVGGSALACFVLFQAIMDEVTLLTGVPFHTVNVAKLEVMIGGLIGITMIFVFAGWAISAVGKTAQQVVYEVRRQFANKPGIMNWTEKPEYGQCVAIVTSASLREMVKPAVLALATPVCIGVVFKIVGDYTNQPLLAIEVCMSFLLFASLTSLLMAIFFDNSGGAWDNAKKLIEKRGEKGTEVHKAAVTGDTVGDPFKDTAGPSLHVIITTMSTTILVLGPLFVGRA